MRIGCLQNDALLCPIHVFFGFSVLGSGLISLVKKHSEAILGTVNVNVTATPVVRQVFVA